MHLLACYPEVGPWKSSPLMIYELSSASHVLYWTWTQRQSLLNTLPRSPAPGREDDTQLQALCSFICAKTGLVLYDLSKHQALEL